jgi:glycerophosphoryl diester phosphodiesterase
VIPVLRGDGRLIRIGHRGAAALAPENTVSALAAAVAAGVDAVEFDVLPLADGTLVLAHSDDLLEVTHGRVRGRLREQSAAELRAIEPALATLDEALSFAAVHATGTGLVVDVKQPGYEAELVAALGRAGVQDRTIVSSYFRETLRRVGALEPALRIGVSYPLDRRRLSRFRALTPALGAALGAMRVALPARIGAWLESTGATAATLHHLLVSGAVIERCHARGAAVFAWTVDDAKTMRRLARAGVDGVITNDPRLFDGYPP